jgi:hypothetical protein
MTDMTTQEIATSEIQRWKPALLAELQRQAAGKIPFQELGRDHDYHEKLPNPVYIIAIGTPPSESFEAYCLDANGKEVSKIFDSSEEAESCAVEKGYKTRVVLGVDHRSLIIGAAVEEAAIETNPNRFVPHLISSEVVEFSEKFGRGRCGYPHHILYASRANGIPSYKSVVKRALKRSGTQDTPKKTTISRPERTPVPVSSGKGYLISPIKGSDEVVLHIGMLRTNRSVAEKITKLIDGVEDENEHEQGD